MKTQLLRLSILLALLVPMTGRSGTVYVNQKATGTVHDGSSWANAYLELRDALGNPDTAPQIIPELVNFDTDTITFATPHGLTQGQAVVYDNYGAGFDLPGLNNKQTYYVIWKSPTEIQLSAFARDAATHTQFDLGWGHEHAFVPSQVFNIVDNIITFKSPHGFANEQPVLYLTDGTIQGVKGLVSGTIYYVSRISDTKIKLADSAIDTAGTPLDIDYFPNTLSLTGIDPGSPSISFDLSAVDFINNTITVPAGSGLYNNQAVTYHGSAILGPVDGKGYFIRVVNDTTIQLLLAGSPVHFSNPGAQGFGVVFDPDPAVSLANDTITYPSPHGFSTGQVVVYNNGAGLNIGGLTSGTNYYVISVDANTFKLAASGGDASAGTAIDLNAGGPKALLVPNAAVSAASAADPLDILIASGTYKPTGTSERGATFNLQSHIRLRGGFAGNEAGIPPRNIFDNPVILSGDIGTLEPNSVTPDSEPGIYLTPVMLASTNDPDFLDNCYHVLEGTAVVDVLLENLTVTGGNANFSAPSKADIDAMVTQDTSTDAATQAGNMVTPLEPLIAGGGLYLSGGPTPSQGSPAVTLSNCKFIGNYARGFGGAVAANGVSVRVQNGRYQQNTAGFDGGGIWSHNGFVGASGAEFVLNRCGFYGGALSYETFISQATFAPDLADPAFQTQYGMARSNFMAVMQTSVGVFKLRATAWNLIQASTAQEVATQKAEGDTKSVLFDVESTLFKKAIGFKLSSFIGDFAAGAVCKIMDIGTLVTILDLGTQIAILDGADPNSKAVKGIELFVNKFNEYATPLGWFELLTADHTAYVDSQENAAQFRILEEEMFNPNAPNVLENCSFYENSSAGRGGAIDCARDNLYIRSCLFQQNVAASVGGVAFGAFNYPVIVNSIFDANVATNDYSAISCSLDSDAFIVNCTIVNNETLDASGAAVSVALGSQVKISNDILWGNTDGDDPRGGADIYCATTNTLDDNTLQNYNDGISDGSFINWVGLVDISYSCVQSLFSFPPNEDAFPLSKDNYSAIVRITNPTDAVGPTVRLRGAMAAADKGGYLSYFNYNGIQLPNVGEGYRANSMFVPGPAPYQGLDDRIFGILGEFDGVEINYITTNNWEATVQNSVTPSGQISSYGGLRYNTEMPPQLTVNFEPMLVSPVVGAGNPNLLPAAYPTAEGISSTVVQFPSTLPVTDAYNLFLSASDLDYNGNNRIGVDPQVEWMASDLTGLVGNAVSFVAVQVAANPNSTLVQEISYAINQDTVGLGLDNVQALINSAVTTAGFSPQVPFARGAALESAAVAAVVSVLAYPVALQRFALTNGSNLPDSVANLVANVAFTASNPGVTTNDILAAITNYAALAPLTRLDLGAVQRQELEPTAPPLAMPDGSPPFDPGSSAIYGQQLALRTSLFNQQQQQAAARILYVRNSGGNTVHDGLTWNTAMSSIADALAVAATGTEIWDASSGTETLAGSVVIKDGVAVYGGFSGTETNRSQRSLTNGLTGLAVAPANTFILSFAGRGGLLDGYDVRFANGASAVIVDGAGGATISNCKFDNNTGAAQGSAIFVEPGSPLDVENCDFENNSAVSGGAIYSAGGPVTGVNCTFTQNLATNGPGGAVCLVNNSTGQVTAYFQNCVFDGNGILGNGTSAGGGIYSQGFDATVLNCTFADNHAAVNASFGGGGIDFEFNPAPTNSPPTLQIQNSIFWNNQALGGGNEPAQDYQQIYFTSVANLLIASCLIQDLDTLPAANSLSGDPDFVDEAGFNLQLLDYSPAIDAGNDNAPLTSLDLAGNPRHAGTHVDLGAYEFQGAASLVVVPVTVSDSCGLSQGNFTITAQVPGAATGLQWLQDALDGTGFQPIPASSALYSGAQTTQLNIPNPPGSMAGYRFRLTGQSGGVPFMSAVGTLPPPPPIRYVNVNATGLNNGSTWQNAYMSLADALAAARECSQIWVARGTYTAPANSGGSLGTLLEGNVAIYGGFAGNESSLSDRSSSWNVSGTVIAASLNIAPFVANDSVVLDNLIFAGATNSAVTAQSVALRINHCLFTNNIGSDGGALYANDNSGVVMTDCMVQGNRAGAGGGVFLDGASLNAMNCVFTNNVADNGGALFCSDNAGVRMVDCVVRGNGAGEGGGIYSDTSALNLTNCLFVENVSGFDGGAVSALNSVLNVVNCTIAYNQAANIGGGLDQQRGSVQVRNSILWGNLGSSVYSDLPDWQLHHESGDSVALDHCLIQGIANNPAQSVNPYDPLLVNPTDPQPALRDFHLTAVSPALNAGDSAAVLGTTTDLGGNPRTRVSGQAVSVDLGAYQFTGTPATAPVLALQAPQSVTTCFAVASVSFTLALADGAASPIVWEASTNAADPHFAAVVTNETFQITTANGVSTLTVVNPSTAMSGFEFQVALTGFSYVTPPATLTVLPPHILYVNAAATGTADGSSWTNAFTNLQDALSAGDSCAQIWVAHGTYVARSAPPAGLSYAMRPGLRIYGGFAGNEVAIDQRDSGHPTILVSAGNAPIFQNLGDAASPLDHAALLDGFTLRSQNGAAAIYNQNAQPTIQNCLFQNCSTNAIVNQSSSGIISNCVFIGGGDVAIENIGSSPQILGCTFTKNHGSYYGGAIYNSDSSPTIADCAFNGNTAVIGGAVANLGNSRPTVLRSQFFANSGSNEGGAICNLDATVRLTVWNSVFGWNTSGFAGGAIANFGNGLQMVNCTVADNRAGVNAGGLYNQGQGAVIANSIFWDNALADSQSQMTVEDAQLLNATGTLVVWNSCVEALTRYAGNGNIFLNPLFTNPGTNTYGPLTTNSSGTVTIAAVSYTNDFALLPQSPLIDQGNSAWYPTNGLDVLQNSRVAGAAVDMGAYELPGARGNSLALLQLPQSATGCSGTTVQFTVIQANGGTLPFIWQDSGGNHAFDFENIPLNDGIHSVSVSGSTNTLTIRNPQADPNGPEQIRVVLADGSFAGAPVSLTVIAPHVIHVNGTAAGANNGTTWVDAYTSLADAIAAADACSEIWVAHGTYHAAAANQSLEMYSGLKLYGGFAGTESARNARNWQANHTILQAWPGQALVANSGDTLVDAYAILDGFVLHAAAGQVSIGNFQASPAIQNCVFENSTLAAINNSEGSSPLIANCVFTNCQQSAIVNLTGSAPTITNSIFTGNFTPGSGGAIASDSSSPVIVQCTFSNNSAAISGGALDFSDNCHPTVLNCLFFANSTLGDGGAVSGEGTFTLTQAVFGGNHAGNQGGAIAGLGPALTLINCTVANNVAAFQGGGLLEIGGSVTAVNSIFSGNSGSAEYTTVEQMQIYGEAGATVSPSYCDIQGLNQYAGNNNQGFDPLFANPAGNDYSLDPTYSPLVDAGNGTAVAGIVHDVTGVNPRIQGSHVDIGAYEQPAGTTPLQPLQISAYTGTTSGCLGGVATFSVTYDSTTNLVWELDSGSGFQDLLPQNLDTNPLFVSGVAKLAGFAGNSTLTFYPLSANMNGWRVRLVNSLGLVSAAGFKSAPFTLTVASPTILRVSPAATGTGDGSSWQNAFTNLTAAVTAAGDCSEVWVAAGVYSNQNSSGVLLGLHAGMAVYGGFNGAETARSQRNWQSNPTVLTAPAGQGVVYNDGNFALVDESAVLDGFILTGVSSRGFAAVENVNNANPTIQNCTFTSNATYSIYSSQSSPGIYKGVI